MLLEYKRIKHILLKYYRNVNTQIKITGIINTTLFVENTNILIDKRKIIFSNKEYKNIIIELQDITKIDILNKWHLIFKNKFLTIDIQQ